MKNERLERLIKQWEETDLKLQLGEGTKTVIRAYENSQGYDYLLIEDGWEQYAQEMIDLIKVCKFEKFLFNDTSTEGLKILKVFINNGALIRRTVKIDNEYNEEALLLEL